MYIVLLDNIRYNIYICIFIYIYTHLNPESQQVALCTALKLLHQNVCPEPSQAVQRLF